VQDVNWTALTIFVLLFAFITWLGFAAANWRRGDLDLLHEWGLGGRRFGTLVTWFLVGGDLYTAYTFIAVPALAFGAGAVAFFAVPYTIVAYPIFFLVFPRIWYVCHKHNYITAGDFVRGRFGNRWLALAVTVTGIVATMPYIALQLVGLQVVIGALGVSGTGFAADLPLIIAFVILAAFTYSSGLRAPASIAIVKDILIYLTAFAAVIVIPIELGGFGKIFSAVAGNSRPQYHRRLQRLCNLGAGLGAGTVSLSAFPYGNSEREQRSCGPPERGIAAGLFLYARPAGARRLLRHRRRGCQPSRIRPWLQAVRQ
jgi:solute:Na+ symporter, SSS family